MMMLSAATQLLRYERLFWLLLVQLLLLLLMLLVKLPAQLASSEQQLCQHGWRQQALEYNLGMKRQRRSGRWWARMMQHGSETSQVLLPFSADLGCSLLACLVDWCIGRWLEARCHAGGMPAKWDEAASVPWNKTTETIARKGGRMW